VKIISRKNNFIHKISKLMISLAEMKYKGDHHEKSIIGDIVIFICFGRVCGHVC
jgi:hypothetical protein